MGKRTAWDDIKAERPLSEEGRAAYEDEARVSAFRALVHRLRTDAGSPRPSWRSGWAPPNRPSPGSRAAGPGPAWIPSNVSPQPLAPNW
jgi:hypothetical protein